MGKDPKRLLRTARGEAADVSDLDNPLDFIAEDHMREREVCAVIDRIIASASIERAEIDQVLTFLETELPQHLADEEIDLFPMMLKRCEPEDEIDKVIDKLQSDHGHAIADAPAIVAIIRGFDKPNSRPSQSDYEQMMDLSRDCAAPLTTYRVAKENTDGITTDRRIPRRSSACRVDERLAA